MIYIEAKNIVWLYSRDERRDEWVAKCDLLGLEVSTEYFEFLAEEIGAALETILTDVIESAEETEDDATEVLTTFIKDRGWSLRVPITDDLAVMLPSFDIPFDLVRE